MQKRIEDFIDSTRTYLQGVIQTNFTAPQYNGPIMDPSNKAVLESEADGLDKVIGGKRWRTRARVHSGECR